MKKMFVAIWLVLLLMVLIAAACTKSVANNAAEEQRFEITTLDGKEIGSVMMNALPDGNARINVNMVPSAVEGFAYLQPVLTRSADETKQEVFATLERVDKTDLVSENSPIVATNGLTVSYDALKFTRVLTLRLNVGESDQTYAEVRLQR